MRPIGIPEVKKSNGQVVDAEERVRITLSGLAGAFGADELRGLAVLSTIVDDMIAQAIAEARQLDDTGRPWRSWAEIGASLGVSKQAAQQRFSGTPA